MSTREKIVDFLSGLSKQTLNKMIVEVIEDPCEEYTIGSIIVDGITAMEYFELMLDAYYGKWE